MRSAMQGVLQRAKEVAQDVAQKGAPNPLRAKKAPWSLLHLHRPRTTEACTEWWSLQTKTVLNRNVALFGFGPLFRVPRFECKTLVLEKCSRPFCELHLNDGLFPAVEEIVCYDPAWDGTELPISPLSLEKTLQKIVCVSPTPPSFSLSSSVPKGNVRVVWMGVQDYHKWVCSATREDILTS